MHKLKRLYDNASTIAKLHNALNILKYFFHVKQSNSLFVVSAGNENYKYIFFELLTNT